MANKKIEELEKLATEMRRVNAKIRNEAKRICEEEQMIWSFKTCKEKGCKWTYRQKLWCGTYGCIHSFSDWTGDDIPYEDKFAPKE